MSVVAATRTPAQKLKKTSAVYLLMGVIGLVVGVISITFYQGASDPNSYSINSAQNVFGMVAAVGFLVAWPSLIVSAVVRIVAAIKA